MRARHVLRSIVGVKMGMGVQTHNVDRNRTRAEQMAAWLSGYQASPKRHDLRFGSKEFVAEFFKIITKYQTYTRISVSRQQPKRPAIMFSKHPILWICRKAMESIQCLMKGNSSEFGQPRRSPTFENGLGAHSLRHFFTLTIVGDCSCGHKPNILPLKKAHDRMGANDRDIPVISFRSGIY